MRINIGHQVSNFLVFKLTGKIKHNMHTVYQQREGPGSMDKPSILLLVSKFNSPERRTHSKLDALEVR